MRKLWDRIYIVMTIFNLHSNYYFNKLIIIEKLRDPL